MATRYIGRARTSDEADEKLLKNLIVPPESAGSQLLRRRAFGDVLAFELGLVARP